MRVFILFLSFWLLTCNHCYALDNLSTLENSEKTASQTIYGVKPYKTGSFINWAINELGFNKNEAENLELKIKKHLHNGTPLPNEFYYLVTRENYKELSHLKKIHSIDATDELAVIKDEINMLDFYNLYLSMYPDKIKQANILIASRYHTNCINKVMCDVNLSNNEKIKKFEKCSAIDATFSDFLESEYTDTYKYHSLFYKFFSPPMRFIKIITVDIIGSIVAGVTQVPVAFGIILFNQLKSSSN